MSFPKKNLHKSIRYFFWFWARCLHMLVGQGAACRFEPTCSHYVAEVFSKHGVAKGSLFSLRRLARCHPLGKPGWDPVPGQKPRIGRVTPVTSLKVKFHG